MDKLNAMSSPRQLHFDSELQAELDDARQALRRLEEENRRLRDQLEMQDASAHELQPRITESVAPLSPEAKIALFRILFRGRDDVYAQRWEAPDGRHGYAPVLRPGVRRIRGQPVNLDDCLPLSDQAIRNHLEGGPVLGIYPMQLDETTAFLAIDFDKTGWSDDVRAVAATCDRLGVAHALERSRSGNGAHIWVFFERPIPASLARNLGCSLLTGAIDRRHQISFASYDRLFPSQDTMPKGGFGNLIALPLQGTARKSDNTVFLTPRLQPYRDQWSTLASIQRCTAPQVERIVRDAAKRGVLIGVGADWFNSDSGDGRPWELPPSRQRKDDLIVEPSPADLELVVSHRVFIPTDGLSSQLIARLRRMAAFQNPEFYAAERMRLSTFGKPRIIDCSEDFPEHIALPRGCSDAVRELLKSLGVTVVVTDKRQRGQPISVAFHGDLTRDQARAAGILIKHDTGVLCAPTAFGKTVIGAWLIAQRRTNTLVLVHRRHLLDQWRERLAFFLNLPIETIGQIGAGRRRPTGVIDVGLLASLTRKGAVDDGVANYGQVIVDECHHIPAFSFERVLSEVRARFVTGLTATPIRKDGHHPIVVMQCGPIRHKVDARLQAAARAFDHVVLERRTSFVPRPSVQGTGIQGLYSELAADESRTNAIVADIVEAVARGRSPLVLTERTDHLAVLAGMVKAQIPHTIVLRGGMGARQRAAAMAHLASLPDDEPRVIVATGRYIGEGFDDSRLDTLFLAMPVAWRGTIQQYAGRLHRDHANKRVVQIYDYVDAEVPVLARMFEKRLQGYSAIGYSFGNDERTQRETRLELATSTLEGSRSTN